jgi:tetratricopeptide (TPR) repeat protein
MAQHPRTLVCLNNLAIVLEKMGKKVEAWSIHIRTLESRRQTLGARHHDTLSSVHNVEVAIGRMGQREEAERLHRQVITDVEELLGPNHGTLIVCRLQLVNALRSQDKLEEAERLARDLVDLSTKVMGPDHPSTALVLEGLGRVLGRAQKAEEAEKVYRAALLLKRKVLGMGHPETLKSMKRLELVLHRQSKAAEADELRRQMTTQGEAGRKEPRDWCRFVGEPQAWEPRPKPRPDPVLLCKRLSEARELSDDADPRQSYLEPQLIGEGGSAKVYAARHCEDINKIVAFKIHNVLPLETPSKGMPADIIGVELEWMRKCAHKNVDGVFGGFVTNESVIIALEYFAGGALLDVIDSGMALP